MSICTGVGSSMLSDAFEAGKSAAKAAIEDLQEGAPHAVLVLASSIFDQKRLIAGVREAVPDIPLVGCTTAGEIVTAGPQQRSVAVCVLQSDTVSFYPVRVEEISKDMNGSGRKFAESLFGHSGQRPKFAFVFSDGLSGNGTDLLRGIFKLAGASFSLIGGAAGDDGAMKKTYQYFGNEVTSDTVVGLGLAGDFNYVVGAGHGWEKAGPSHKVTKAQGTTLYEVDGKPAFSLYQELFGDKAEKYRKPLSMECITYPLGMEVEGSNTIMVRSPIAFGEDDSIVCGAEVIEGSMIYIMVGTVQGAKDAVKFTLEDLRKKYGGQFPSLIFASECITRRLFLGDQGGPEFEILKSMSSSSTNIFGFASYGQFAPLKEKAPDLKTCDPGFYEQAMALALLG